MDPQKITLDPKLKEAYDSVMGNKPPLEPKPPISSVQQQPVITQSWPTSGPQIINQPPTSFSLSQPSLHIHSPLPAPKIVAYHFSTQNNKQLQGRKWRLRWIFVAFLVVVFLLGYAIFWIKVFGIKLPILSNFL